MDSPLEEISFLARSENRVRVLRSIADEGRTRRELREESAVSSSTLSRILNEFETRGWVERAGREYTTTPAADAILGKFLPLLETVEGIQNVEEFVDWLPPPARSVDFRHLRDAEITTSTAENPAEPFDRGLELIRAAEEYLGLTSTAIPRYVEALSDGILAGRLEVEGVIEASFVETLRTAPGRAVPWYDLAGAGDVWVYDGRVPINMHVVDGTVLVWLGERGDDGLEIHGLLETDDPSVSAWAESLYEEYRAEAEPLDPAMLPET